MGGLAPQSQRLITRRNDDGSPSKWFWVCPVCSLVYYNQISARLCCSRAKGLGDRVGPPIKPIGRLTPERAIGPVDAVSTLITDYIKYQLTQGDH